MSVLTKHRFTTKDYYRMAETGVLPPDARVELLDGEIIDTAPIGPFHGGSVNHLNQLFNNPSAGRYLVAVQNPVHLDEHSEPQPDLMLLTPTKDKYKRRHPQPQDVLLLIEVSETSLDYDRSRKLPAYGRAGIPEVWIINLPDKTIEIYREPHLAGYVSKTILRASKKASPAAFPDVQIDVSELLNI